jgi:hypothetical protein
MRRFHIALSVADIEASVPEYSRRLGCDPQIVVSNEYALWRTGTVNFSIRSVPASQAGALRHLGWEDPDAGAFSTETDVNGLLWERFAPEHQRDEILTIWPAANDYLGK